MGGFTADSRKLENGFGVVCAGFSFLSRLWGWGTVTFQLSGSRSLKKVLMTRTGGLYSSIPQL